MMGQGFGEAIGKSILIFACICAAIAFGIGVLIGGAL